MTKPRPANPFAPERGPIVFAHRGWRGYYPENTMLALQKAAELDIDALELDIHSTADGVLVVHHDDTLDRTTNGMGAINRYTWAELQTLDAGFHFSKDGGKTHPFRGQGITIPSLEQVYKAFPDLWINIDIKQHQPSIVQPFANLIARLSVAERTCVGSFDDPTVYAFRKLSPQTGKSGSEAEVRRMFIANKLRLPFLYKGDTQVFQIPEFHNGIHLVTPSFVKTAHKNNVAIQVWTVNETSEMQRFIDMGVDGIVTDYPDKLLGLVD